MSRGLYKKLTTNRETFVNTLARLFEYSTSTFEKRTALTYVDGGQKYTYGQLRAKSIELSHIFARYGLCAGDRIAILSQNMPNLSLIHL